MKSIISLLAIYDIPIRPQMSAHLIHIRYYICYGIIYLLNNSYTFKIYEMFLITHNYYYIPGMSFKNVNIKINI